MVRQCMECGKMFETRTPNKQVCSKACSLKRRRRSDEKRRRGNGISVRTNLPNLTKHICTICGQEFVGGASRKTCGKQCDDVRKQRFADKQERRRTCSSWGLGYDPYATGALPSDAMHCPVM